MEKNRRVFEGHQYTVPSPTSYPYQWLWDSCFHAIILSHWSTEDAKKELLSLISKQFPNGMVPHIIYWGGKTDNHDNDHLNRIDWGKEDTSTITQPPLIAQASMRIYQKDNDKNFLETIYPHIKSFCEYLIKESDPHNTTLSASLILMNQARTTHLVLMVSLISRRNKLLSKTSGKGWN